MNITFRTGGLLGEHLPPGSGEDEAELDVKPGATPIDVMKQLGFPLEDFYLIIVNDEVVPQERWGSETLGENDVLGIFPPLKGG